MGQSVGFDLAVHDLDQDAFEDGSVEHLPQRWFGLAVVVGRAGFAKQLQRVFQRFHDVVDLGNGLSLSAFDLSLLFANADLFVLHDLNGDGVAVVELDELLLLSGQLAESPCVSLGFSRRGVGLLFDERPDRRAERVLFFGREPWPRAMQFDDDVLDFRYGGIRIATGSGLPDAAETRVILVVGAELAAVIAVAEPLATDPAMDGAVQIVPVFLGAFASLTVGIEDALHLLECLQADERFVTSGSLDTVSGHDAGVVVVAQDTVQRRTSNRAGWPRRCRSGAQSGFRNEIAERRQGVLTARCEVEQDLYQRPTFGIDRY